MNTYVQGNDKNTETKQRVSRLQHISFACITAFVKVSALRTSNMVAVAHLSRVCLDRNLEVALDGLARKAHLADNIGVLAAGTCHRQRAAAHKSGTDNGCTVNGKLLGGARLATVGLHTACFFKRSIASRSTVLHRM